MNIEDFKALKEGTILYDAKYSRINRRHETVTVIEHSKDGRGIILRDGLGNELYAYSDCWGFDVMPHDESSLPFY